MNTPLAILFALIAAALYGVGNALEHRVAQELPGEGRVDPGLLRRLARVPRWWFGMFGDVAAYGFQAAALAVGALLVVQPLLVCGVLFALPLSARWNGRRLRRDEWTAAIVLCAALTIFLVEADPSGDLSSAPVWRWAIVGGSVLAVTVAAIGAALVFHGSVRATLLGFAAGALFGITAALTKTFVDQIQRGVPYTAEHWEVYALAALSIAGILLTQNGFQAASLPASLPALEATEPMIASVMGILVLHEHLNGDTSWARLLVGVAIAAILVAIVTLARAAGGEERYAAEQPAPVHHALADEPFS